LAPDALPCSGLEEAGTDEMPDIAGFVIDKCEDINKSSDVPVVTDGFSGYFPLK